MPGISGHKGCSEGQEGSVMRTIVLQERAELGHLHLLLILAQPPANTLSHPRDVRSDAAVQNFLENFSSSAPRVWRYEMEGLGAVSGHPFPHDGCGDLLLAPLQAPPSPHAHLLSCSPNPRGFGHPGVGLAPGAQPAVVVQQLLQE